jgi:hypothetical protein
MFTQHAAPHKNPIPPPRSKKSARQERDHATRKRRKKDETRDSIAKRIQTPKEMSVNRKSLKRIY